MACLCKKPLRIPSQNSQHQVRVPPCAPPFLNCCDSACVMHILHTKCGRCRRTIGNRLLIDANTLKTSPTRWGSTLYQRRLGSRWIRKDWSFARWVILLVLWIVVVACIVVTSGVGVVTLHSCLHNTIGSWTSSPLQELIALCATRYLPWAPFRQGNRTATRGSCAKSCCGWENVGPILNTKSHLPLLLLH